MGATELGGALQWELLKQGEQFHGNYQKSGNTSIEDINSVRAQEEHSRESY